MQPVSGGWVSHKIKGDGDYEAKKRAALAQSKTNSFTQGVQSVMDDGPCGDSKHPHQIRQRQFDAQ